MNKLVIPLIFLGICVTRAQDVTSHEVSFPTGDAAWNVSIEYSEATPNSPEAAPKKFPESVEVVRKGNMRRDKTRWTDGTTTETWWTLSPGIVLLHAKPDEPAYPIRPGHLGALRFDEANFDWVNAESFKGLTGSETQPVRVYDVTLEFEDLELYYYAEIDGITGQPLVWSDGEMTATFEFVTPPAEPLVMPKKYHEELRRIARRLAPPKRMGKR